MNRRPRYIAICAVALLALSVSVAQSQAQATIEDRLVIITPVARTAGWVSHWLEQQNDPENKIGRPRQIYTGAAKRDYVPLASR